MFYEYYFLRGIKTHRTIFVSHTEICILFNSARVLFDSVDNSCIFSIHRGILFFSKISLKKKKNRICFINFNQIKIEQASIYYLIIEMTDR